MRDRLSQASVKPRVLLGPRDCGEVNTKEVNETWKSQNIWCEISQMDTCGINYFHMTVPSGITFNISTIDKVAFLFGEICSYNLN